MEDFFKSPLQIQIALGAGYLGYITAYAGIRAHHQQTDVAFQTVAFGIVAILAAGIVSPLMPAMWAIVCCVAASVIAGFVWRKLGRPLLRFVLRKGRVSFSSDDLSVLNAIWTNTAHNVSQVWVVLNDGSEYSCQNTGDFRNAAIAPFIYGDDGSIAMYVTHSYRRDIKGELVSTARTHTRDPVWGDQMTIIPAASIRNVSLRFQRKT